MRTTSGLHGMLRKTNFPFTITPATVNGVHLKLLPPLLVANRWQSSQKDISIIIGADPGFQPEGHEPDGGVGHR